MCFILQRKRAKIAKSNIVCYKISNHLKYSKVEKYFRPHYFDKFKYILNKKTSKVCLSVLIDEISEGYHSYKDKNNQMVLWKKRTYKIGKFIIPKGTKYYENETEYVSETLIFKGYIK